LWPWPLTYDPKINRVHVLDLAVHPIKFYSCRLTYTQIIERKLFSDLRLSPLRILVVLLLYIYKQKTEITINSNKITTNPLTILQPLDIWYTVSTRGPIPWDSISGLSLFDFLFTDLVKILDINARSMIGKFRNSFLSNYLSQPLDIWHTALTRGPILWDSISDPSNSSISCLST
jgi:hypothetical protein